MRFRGFVAVVALSVVPFALGCAQSEIGPGSGGTGGTVSTSSGTGGSATGRGGESATGGSSATGGARAPGGAAATDGSTGSAGQGGVVATGGARATGGSTGQGGAVTTGGGGAPATGGSTGTAGSSTTGTGGHASSGAGGSSAAGTGGHASTGSGGSSTGAAGHGSSGGGGQSTGGTGASTGGAGGSTATGAAGSTSTGGGGSTTSTAGGTIVPLYTDPSDPSWSAIATAAEAHPTVHVVAIVNPNNGPGSAKDSGYTAGIADLQAAGIKVIGYVATGYASHSIASMEAEIDSWKSFYPTLQGIFFDEQSDATGDVAHYQTLSQYAKSVGLSYTVGNPGTGVPTAYVGALDTMLIYESNGVPPISDLSAYSAYAPSNFGVIPYAVSSMNSTFVQQARQYVEYVYLTNDDLPNPWDSLTSYFPQLLDALE
jgi:Spherulation-specific family 4